MNELVQHMLPPTAPRYQPPTTLSETNERLLELRMTEMETHEDIVDHLRQVHARKLWQKAGFKSFAEFCEKELSYSSSQTRELMIEVGLILTSNSLRANSPQIQNRIDRLRAWRRDKASRAGVAAFRVLTNRTLLALAEIPPISHEELLKIPGFGPKKLEEFGDELLMLLATESRESIKKD